LKKPKTNDRIMLYTSSLH